MRKMCAQTYIYFYDPRWRRRQRGLQHTDAPPPRTTHVETLTGKGVRKARRRRRRRSEIFRGSGDEGWPNKLPYTIRTQ